nr:hypothetical protein [uncultured Lachnoanaerobaculum sp.]
MEKLVITQLKTTKVSIVNIEEAYDVALNVEINRSTHKITSDDKFSYFYGEYTVNIVRSDETNDNRTFSLEYNVSANFYTHDPSMDIKDVTDLITVSIAPHLRAGIASLMGACGLQPILIPELFEAPQQQ